MNYPCKYDILQHCRRHRVRLIIVSLIATVCRCHPTTCGDAVQRPDIPVLKGMHDVRVSATKFDLFYSMSWECCKDRPCLCMRSFTFFHHYVLATGIAEQEICPPSACPGLFSHPLHRFCCGNTTLAGDVAPVSAGICASTHISLFFPLSLCFLLVGCPRYT